MPSKVQFHWQIHIIKQDSMPKLSFFQNDITLPFKPIYLSNKPYNMFLISMKSSESGEKGEIRPGRNFSSFTVITVLTPNPTTCLQVDYFQLELCSGCFWNFPKPVSCGCVSAGFSSTTLTVLISTLVTSPSKPEMVLLSCRKVSCWFL